MIKVCAVFFLINNLLATYPCPSSSPIADPLSGGCYKSNNYKQDISGKIKCSPNSAFFNFLCSSCGENSVSDSLGIKCVSGCSTCGTCRLEKGSLVTRAPSGQMFDQAECLKCPHSSQLPDQRAELTGRCTKCFINDNHSVICNCPQGSSQVGLSCSGLDLNEFYTKHYDSSPPELRLFCKDDVQCWLKDSPSTRPDLLYSCVELKSNQSCKLLSFLCSLATDYSSGYCISNNQEASLSTNLQNADSFKNILMTEFDDQGKVKETLRLNLQPFGIPDAPHLVDLSSKNFTKEYKRKINFTKKTKFFKLTISVDDKQINLPVFNRSFTSTLSSLLTIEEALSNYNQFTFFDHAVFQSFGEAHTKHLKELSIVYFKKKNGEIIPFVIADYELANGLGDETFSKFKMNSMIVEEFSEKYIGLSMGLAGAFALGLILSLVGIGLKARDSSHLSNTKNFIKEVAYWWLRTSCYFLTLGLLIAYLILQNNFQGKSMPLKSIFPSEYIWMDAYSWLLALCWTLSVAWKLFRQTAIRIHLIDWEKPNIFKTGTEEPKEEVSMWRSMMFFNELKEELTSPFLGYLFFLLGFLALASLINIDNTGCQLYSNDNLCAEQNAFLRYGVILGLALLVGFGLEILTYAWTFLSGEGYRNLIDLSSVCNISLVVSREHGRATYIHGRNSFDTGEGSLPIIYKKLEMEASGLGAGRGMVDNSDEQVFDVMMLGKEDLEEDMVDLIKEEVESRNFAIRKRSSLLELLGLSGTGGASDNNLNNGGLLFFVARDSFILKFFFRTLTEELIFTGVSVIALLDKLTGSFNLGAILAYLIYLFFSWLYEERIVKTLVKHNRVDERFLI